MHRLMPLLHALGRTASPVGQVQQHARGRVELGWQVIDERIPGDVEARGAEGRRPMQPFGEEAVEERLQRREAIRAGHTLSCSHRALQLSRGDRRCAAPNDLSYVGWLTCSATMAMTGTRVSAAAAMLRPMLCHSSSTTVAKSKGAAINHLHSHVQVQMFLFSAWGAQVAASGPASAAAWDYSRAG